MSLADPAPRSRQVRIPSPKKRAAIISAARELVSTVGFREAQMSVVAEAANVALGTLYRHFPSKVALMAEVVSLVSQREVDVAAGIAMGEGTAGERLSASALMFAQRAVRSRRLAHALVAEPVEPEIEAARLVYRRKLARVFETIVEQGVRTGEFPPQDIAASGACIVGSLFEGLVGPLTLNDLASDDEQRQNAKAIIAFCLRGVGCGTDLTCSPFSVGG